MAILTNDEAFAMLGKSTPTSAETALMNLLLPMVQDAVRNEVGYSIEQADYTHYLPIDSATSGEVDAIDVINDRVVLEYRREQRELFVPERPLRSVTALYEDRAAFGGQGAGDFAAGTELTQGTHFQIDWTDSGVSWTGRLLRIYAGWSPFERTIKVQYTAGLTAGEIAGTTPIRGPVGGGVTQIKLATLVATIQAFKEPQQYFGTNAGPITSERLADYAVTYAQNAATDLFGLKLDLPQRSKELLAPFKRILK